MSNEDREQPPTKNERITLDELIRLLGALPNNEQRRRVMSTAAAFYGIEPAKVYR